MPSLARRGRPAHNAFSRKRSQFILTDVHSAPAGLKTPTSFKLISRKRSQFILTDVHNAPAGTKKSLCCNENSRKRSQFAPADVRNIPTGPKRASSSNENSRKRSQFIYTHVHSEPAGSKIINFAMHFRENEANLLCQVFTTCRRLEEINFVQRSCQREAVHSRSGCRSPDAALEHLAHPGALPHSVHGGMGIQESPTNGIKVVRTI
jgi:hypothetical protein